MDVLTKGKRIRALSEYIEYKSDKVSLNYHLNNLIDQNKAFIVRLQDIYDNIYRVFEYDNLENTIEVDPVTWEKIVSDMYAQFYHISYEKAKTLAVEKITILEIENYIKSFKN
jgi:hypothetical protein